MNNVIPFYYFDGTSPSAISLKESCWINGKPYFTRRAIGEFLEYSKPQEAIDKIIARNPYIDLQDNSVHPNLGCTESGFDWSVDIKLMSTDGKNYDTRVYDPIALQLIINKSNQPKAIAFQVAVARLVVAFLTGALARFTLNEVTGVYDNLFNFCHLVTSIGSVPQQRRMIMDCAAQNNFTIAEVCNLIRQQTGVSVSAPRQCVRKFPDDYATAMAYHREHPLAGGRAIKRACSLLASERQINHWIREAMFAA